jgi:outer membrane protein assembly factor BamB
VKTPSAKPKTETKKPVTVLWEFETEDAVESSPAIASDGIVYIGSSDKKLYAIKTDSKGLAKSPWPMRGQNAQHTGRAPAK